MLVFIWDVGDALQDAASVMAQVTAVLALLDQEGHRGAVQEFWGVLHEMQWVRPACVRKARSLPSCSVLVLVCYRYSGGRH